LTSVTDPHERHVKEGWETRIPRTAKEFEDTFRNSTAYEANLRDIEDFEATLQEQLEARARETSEATKRKNYTVSFQKQVIACTSRQFKVMLGDKLSLGARWIGLGFQSLIVGSLFYNLPSNAQGVFPRGGVLFFTLLFNALLAMAEMTASFDSRPIMLKHKAFSFYRPSAYAIAQVVTDIPLCAVQVLIWGVIVYFMASEYWCYTGC
jgi:ATP-binding cassette subfamily G (WHITE) protein 2 (SNQ2)